MAVACLHPLSALIILIKQDTEMGSSAWPIASQRH